MSGAASLVRRATLADIARLIELGSRFYEEEGNRAAAQSELARFALSHITEPNRICLVAGSPIAGVICGVVSPHYLTGEPTAFKTAWYAEPGARGHGARLLRAFEAWAAECGARRLIVSGREQRTLTLLERLAYHPLETVFAKDIPCQKQPYPLP